MNKLIIDGTTSKPKSSNIIIYGKKVKGIASQNDITIDEAIAAVASHEAEHTTPENIKLRLTAGENGPKEIYEKVPREKRSKIIDEFRAQKPILGKDDPKLIIPIIKPSTL